jgi:hypothetical protein
MKTMIASLTTAVAVLLAVGASTLPAAEGLTPEAIGAAKTAAEHDRIADAYAKEAEALRKKAADHRAMLASYEKGPGYLTEKSGLVQHCQSLISYYDKAAQDAEAMAKMHRELGAKAK